MAKHKILDLTKNLPRDIYTKRQVENVLEEAESIHAREGHMASPACTKRSSILTKHAFSCLLLLFGWVENSLSYCLVFFFLDLDIMKTFKSLSEMIDLFKNNKQLNTNQRMNDNLICNIMEDYNKFVE